MSRMKAMSEAQSQAKKRVPDCIPTKDPYYPLGNYDVLDHRVVEAVLCDQDKVVLLALLDKVRANHTTRAISAHIDNLESKLISTTERLEAHKAINRSLACSSGKED